MAEICLSWTAAASSYLRASYSIQRTAWCPEGTWELWFKQPASGKANQTLVFIIAGVEYGGIRSNTSGQIIWTLYDGSNFQTVTGTSDIFDNAWHHIACTYSESAGKMKLYIDGTKQGTDATIVKFRDTTDTYDFGEGAYSLNALITEMRISNSVRYTGNFTPPTKRFTADANTTRLYHMNEGTGTTVYDTSGNGKNQVMESGGGGRDPQWTNDGPAFVNNYPPNAPTNSTPANLATSISRTPTLTASAFSDPDAGDTHKASQWQVATDSGFTAVVWDSGTTTSNKTSIVVNSTNGTFAGALSGKTRLASNSTYYWHVRYQDDKDEWSSYS